MRFFLMGYGSIAKTLMSIINDLGEEYDIVTCDLKEDGIRGQDIIERDHDKFDAVINLTDEYVLPIIELCDKYGLKYLDAGYEDENSVFVKNFLKYSTSDQENVHLFGFGMNPGLVEYMPFVVEQPDKDYIACVFETDLPVPTEEDKDKLYATWCPTTYYDESVVLDAFVSTENEVCKYISREDRYNIPLETKDGAYDYFIIPHEEVFNIQTRDPKCKASAFVFHAPQVFQDFVLSYDGDDGMEVAAKIPVNNNITGTESVGILLYDGSDNVRYIVNCSDHGECCDRYKHNATCFQTACGVYVGMQLLSMVPDGTTWTFTKASQYYTKEIGAMLDKLGFKIDIIDNYLPKEQFEERILPLFGQEVADCFK